MLLNTSQHMCIYWNPKKRARFDLVEDGSISRLVDNLARLFSKYVSHTQNKEMKACSVL